MSKGELRKVRVWDLPVRLFHWTLLLLMILMFVTAYTGRMAAHAAMGQAVLIMVLFRLIWGFVGSQSARFSHFVRGFNGIRDYLLDRQPKPVGHNPVGALMVVALLATLLAQTLSGMFSSDGIGFDAPFAHWINSVTSDSVTRFHAFMAYVIAGLAVVHVSAVALHWMLHGEDLITPMLSGMKLMPQGSRQPKFVSSVAAYFIVALLVALLAAIKVAA